MSLLWPNRLRLPPFAKAGVGLTRIPGEDFCIPHTPQKQKLRELLTRAEPGAPTLSREEGAAETHRMKAMHPGYPGRSPDSRRNHGPASPSHPICKKGSGFARK